MRDRNRAIFAARLQGAQIDDLADQFSLSAGSIKQILIKEEKLQAAEARRAAAPTWKEVSVEDSGLSKRTFTVFRAHGCKAMGAVFELISCPRALGTMLLDASYFGPSAVIEAGNWINFNADIAPRDWSEWALLSEGFVKATRKREVLSRRISEARALLQQDAELEAEIAEVAAKLGIDC